MKTNRIIALAAAIVAVCACGKQELPYDLAGTEHGVVINIRKVIGTSMTLSTDLNSSNYQVELSIPPQQGDYSMLKEAQLMAVYTGADKTKKAAKVEEGITSFPHTSSIDIKDVCSKLGLTAIAVGDRIEFTPCVTLKSGTQVDGWTELTGFNNTVFTSWQLEDGPLSYRVAYTAFAPFQKEKFQGPAIPWTDGKYSGTFNVTQITDLPGDDWMPKGVTAADLVGLKLVGPFWFEGPGEQIVMWINTQDYTLIIPDQVICPGFTYGSYGTYDGEVAYCEGEVDTLNNTLTFYFYSVWGPYSFGDDTLMLQF